MVALVAAVCAVFVLATPAGAQHYPPNPCPDGSQPPCGPPTDHGNGNPPEDPGDGRQDPPGQGARAQGPIVEGASTPPADQIRADVIRLGDTTHTFLITEGSAIVVTSDGWMPGSQVQIFLESNPVLLATVTADGQGTFTTQLAIPPGTALGPHILRAVGVDPVGRERQVVTHVIVVAADTVAPLASGNRVVTALARTGAPILTLAGVGSIALLTGAWLTVRNRRRLG